MTGLSEKTGRGIGSDEKKSKEADGNGEDDRETQDDVRRKTESSALQSYTMRVKMNNTGGSCTHQEQDYGPSILGCTFEG